MEYSDITTESDADHIIHELQESYKNLSLLILPREYESTMRGTYVLSIYYRFEPIMKLEGSREMLDLFVSKFNQARGNGSSNT
jgi:hypothetical protein